MSFFQRRLLWIGIAVGGAAVIVFILILWTKGSERLQTAQSSFAPSESSVPSPSSPPMVSPPQSSLPQVSPIPTATSPSNRGTPEENAAFAAEVKDVPFDYRTLSAEKELVIRLDSDPRIEGNDIVTEVARRDETFTVFFKEKMDRASVEQQLYRTFPKTPDIVYPRLLAYWSNDRQLHVKAIASELPLELPYMSMYMFDFTDAKMQDGNKISELTYARFRAIIEQPNQWWRISPDGTVKEQMTSFDDPYWVSPVDANGEFLQLARSNHNCGCDAILPYYYSVYDIEHKTIEHYPFEVQFQTFYRGKGNFTADRRGFFFENPENASVGVPSSKTASSLNIKEFIHGASFSKNHDFVIMAVGGEEQTRDFDLLIVSLDTGERRRLPKAVQGAIPHEEAFGRIEPIVFEDDGQRVRFMTGDPGEQRYYKFDWKTGRVTPLEPESSNGRIVRYSESSDSRYRLTDQSVLYRDAVKVLQDPAALPYVYDGVWLPGTHEYYFTDYEGDTTKIFKFDADSLERKTVMPEIPAGAFLRGVDKGGKWIYVTSKKPL